MKNHVRLSLCLTALLISSPRLWAGEEIAQSRTTSASNEVSRDLFELDSSYVFESDLHRGVSFGDQYEAQNSFSYAHRFFLTGNLYLRAGVAYNRFDFGSTFAPVPERLQSLAGIISIDYMHNNDIGAFLEVRPGFYTDDEFDNSSFDAPITLGRIFVLQPDKLYLFVGANAAFLRGRFPVLPIAGIIWMPNDKWKLMAVLPEPRLIYSPSKQFSIWGGGQLTGGSFRTKRDDTIFPQRLSGAQVDYSDYRVGGGFTYTPCNAVSVDLGGGYAIERQFDFHRAGVKYKTDGAPYLRLEFKAHF